MPAPKTDLRAHALDALRGLAILAMVLSGRVPFGVLPGWMYHAQIPPPAHALVSTPGITWVDLVFPFFLFAMGVAFPFALSRKLAQGVSAGRLVWQSLVRGLLLAAFAIFIQHVSPWTLSRQPGPREWAVALLGFGLLFPVLLRLPAGWRLPTRVAVRAAGVAAAVGLLATLHYPDGSGFRLERSNIILLVLANLAFFAWAQGWLAPGFPPPRQAEHEPQRLAAQVRPEAVTVLSSKAASAAVNAAVSDAVVAARAAAVVCLEIGRAHV